MLAYYRITINPADNEALKRIINFPARGIGSTTMMKLESAASNNETTIWKTIIKLGESNPAGLNKGTVSKVLNFVQLIKNFNTYSNENDAFDLQKPLEEAARRLYARDKTAAMQILTNYSNGIYLSSMEVMQKVLSEK